MNLTNKEYELIIESLTVALGVTRRHLATLEEGHQAALRELDRLRTERKELEGDLRAAEAEAQLLKGDLDEANIKLAALNAKSAATDKKKAEKVHEGGPCQQEARK